MGISRDRQGSASRFAFMLHARTHTHTHTRTHTHARWRSTNSMSFGLNGGGFAHHQELLHAAIGNARAASATAGGVSGRLWPRSALAGMH